MKKVIVKSVADVGIYFGKQRKYHSPHTEVQEKLMESMRKASAPFSETRNEMLQDKEFAKMYLADCSDDPETYALAVQHLKEAGVELSDIEVQPEENTAPEGDDNKPPAQVVSVTEFIKVPVEPGLLISGDGEDAGANRAVLPVNPALNPNPLKNVRFEQGSAQWRKPKK